MTFKVGKILCMLSDTKPRTSISRPIYQTNFSGNSWTWDVQFRMEDQVAPRRLPREAAQLRVAEAGRQCHGLPVLRRRRGHRRVGIIVALNKGLDFL